MDLKSQEVESLRPYHKVTNAGSTSYLLHLSFSAEGKPQQLAAFKAGELGIVTAAPCVTSRSVFVHTTLATSLNDIAFHFGKRKPSLEVSGIVSHLLSPGYRDAASNKPKSEVTANLSHQELKACLDNLFLGESILKPVGRGGKARHRPVNFEFVTELIFAEDALSLLGDM